MCLCVCMNNYDKIGLEFTCCGVKPRGCAQKEVSRERTKKVTEKLWFKVSLYKYFQTGKVPAEFSVFFLQLHLSSSCYICFYVCICMCAYIVLISDTNLPETVVSEMRMYVCDAPVTAGTFTHSSANP